MNRRPLALDDRQLHIVMAAAHSIRREWRDRFLQQIADELTARDEITDSDVQLAVALALARMEDAA